jgi:hypothetical protein
MDSNFTSLNSDKLENVVEDLTPQLGGTLDANGNTIDMGVNTITDTKVGQWDTAYGWGDHSTQNYLSTTSSIDSLNDVDTSTVAPTDGQALVWDNTAGQWEPGTVSGSGIANVVEDTTPQLGGDLDLLGNMIYSSSGTPKIAAYPTNQLQLVNDSGTYNATQQWYVFGGVGGILNALQANTAAGQRMFRIQTNGSTDDGTHTHSFRLYGDGDVEIRAQTPAQAATALTLDGTSLTYANNGTDLYTFPTSDGTTGQVLTTNGSGTLSFATVSAEVVNDTTPQLGGDLDINSHYIYDSTDGVVSFREATAGYTIAHFTDGSGNGGSQSTGQLNLYADESDLVGNSIRSMSRGASTYAPFYFQADKLDFYGVKDASNNDGHITFDSNATVDGIRFRISGGDVLRVDNTVITADQPVKLAAYASTALPTASSALAGAQIAISNNSYRPAYCTGTQWLYVHDNSTV